MEVDLILLTRDRSRLRPDVRAGIVAQRGVRLRVHRAVGHRCNSDVNRFETIARARNAARGLGSAGFVMLLDDDVVLGPDCVATLAQGLLWQPVFGALAADSAGEMNHGLDHWDYPRHVGMAAILFRRELLETVTFRWEPGKCECTCCCEDVRRAGFGVGYLQGALAWHRPSSHRRAAAAPDTSAPVNDPAPTLAQSRPTSSPPRLPGRILVAFDREHRRLFRHRFLRTLRASGNHEQVTAVTYGLYPSERRLLALIPGVEVVVARPDGHPAQRRLRDFQRVLSAWPQDVPVAYWDAGDVLFQGRLEPLWEEVRAHPHCLLAAHEPYLLLESPVTRSWVDSILDPTERQRAMNLFAGKYTLNSGFAAGTARVMLRYLKTAEQLLHSRALHGSTDWGDQTALNLFCSANPDAWREVSPTWNYTLIGRGHQVLRADAMGRFDRLDGEPIHVIHGAGGTLRSRDLLDLMQDDPVTFAT